MTTITQIAFMLLIALCVGAIYAGREYSRRKRWEDNDLPKPDSLCGYPIGKGLIADGKIARAMAATK